MSGSPHGSRAERIGTLLELVAPLAAAEREAFLRDQCGTDTALIEEVLSLAAALQGAGEFLEAPVGVARGELPGDLTGHRIGPFEVRRRIGEGGMGQVYEALDTRLDRPVALKVLHPTLAGSATVRARLAREARALAQLNHPGIAAIYGIEPCDLAPGGIVLVLEFVPGITLAARLRQGSLDVQQALHISMAIADALEAAHARGIVHRDLKPSNMMVTPNGHAKILDMGLAFLADEELPADIKIVGGEGYVVGTMDYIAPEQIDNPTAIDGRADLYALGCSMYMALTGRPPFPGGTSIEKMRRHRNAHADPITDHNPTVPADFARIVGRLMEKNPADRYASARHVRKALAPWIAGDPETPLDTDPHQTEAQVLEEIEQAQPDPGSFFESIPVGIFTDRNRKGTPPASPEPKPIAEDGPPPVPLGFRIRRRADRLSGGLTEEFPGWLRALAGFVAFMLPVLVFVIILRALFR